MSDDGIHIYGFLWDVIFPYMTLLQSLFELIAIGIGAERNGSLKLIGADWRIYASVN